MGGRGSLGTRDFKYSSKESVYKALKDKQIILMRDGKVIKDAKNISNKELATLSALAETLNNQGSVKHDIIDIAPTKEGKAMTSSRVKTKSGNIYRKLTINDKHMKQGYKHLDSLYKKKGGLKQVIYKTVNKRKPVAQTKGNPRTKKKESLDDFLAYAKSLSGK